MKSDIEKIQDLIDAIESNILAGSNLTDFQRGCQKSIQIFIDEINVLLDKMEKEGS